MADGGERILTGMVLGHLVAELARARAGESSFAILNVRPIVSDDGQYETAIDVTMSAIDVTMYSGKYRIIVTDVTANTVQEASDE